MRTLTLTGLELRETADIQTVAEFFGGLNPSTLEEVIVHYLVIDPRIIQREDGPSYNGAGVTYGTNTDYVGTCIKLEGALLKYPLKRLSVLFSLSQSCRRQQLWTHELGQLFPMLRKHNQLTVIAVASKLLLRSFLDQLISIANYLLSRRFWS